MFDTIVIANSFARPPDQGYLIGRGWKPIFSNHNGEVKGFSFNQEKGKHNPTLYLAKKPNEHWFIHAEVSLAAWLKGSNLQLPTESEVKPGLELLSAYVSDYSGLKFDAQKGIVKQVDFTRDFRFSENEVLQIIEKYSQFAIPKYTRVCFDNTTVYFRNARGRITKKYMLYSKFHEVLKRKADPAELDRANGLLRMEITLRNYAVSQLSKKLQLDNHRAENILTASASERVIADAMQRLSFANMCNFKNSALEKLSEVCNEKTLLSHVGYIHLKDQGWDLNKLQSLKLSKRTFERYEANCRKAGVSSLK